VNAVSSHPYWLKKIKQRNELIKKNFRGAKKDEIEF
jgi:hypothetical protein